MSDILPIVFFGHGSPTNALEDNRFTQSWAEIGERAANARAILMISAHWCAESTMATAALDLQTIHDFGPIDNRLFGLCYPAKGSPGLVDDVSDALGLADTDLERIRGLDHGAWTVLMKAFPKANIPVVQLSLNMNLSPKDHYSLGMKLSPLRKSGYLIASSGNIVHNLSVMDWQSRGGAFEWASHFNKSIISAVLGQQHDRVLDYGLIAGSDKAVPHPDHFLPLLYTLGASQPDDPISIYTNEIVYRSLGMATLVFG